jgi:hypothetical protein
MDLIKEIATYLKTGSTIKQQQRIQEDASSQFIRFEFTPNEFKELEKIADDFGIELNSIVEDAPVKRVKRKDDFIGMSAKDMETSGVVTKVEKKVLDKMNKLMKTALDAKDWYTDIHTTFIDVLGESDGALLLLLLAATSPKHRFSKNVDFAAYLFAGLKRSLRNKKYRKQIERWIETSNSDTGIEFIKKHQGKGNLFFDAWNRAAMTRLYNNNCKRIVKLYLEKNQLFTLDNVKTELSYHLTSNGRPDEKTTILGKEKVFNFALNLIAPEHKIEEFNWFPVTIDVWMVALFYPNLSKEERDDLINKSSTYVYLAKKIHDKARRLKILPHQLQAILWVAKIRQEQSENYTATIENAIDKGIEGFEKQKRRIMKLEKDVVSFLQKIQERLRVNVDIETPNDGTDEE